MPMWLGVFCGFTRRLAKIVIRLIDARSLKVRLQPFIVSEFDVFWAFGTCFTCPATVPHHSYMASKWSKIKSQLNFFRVHLLFFTFTPLIFSGIFYAANGKNHVSYIDALFNCVSAAVVCGLASIDLSELTGFQQALLFFQSAIGNPVIVSWVMVYIRRHYFAKKFEHIVMAEMERRRAAVEAEGGERRGTALGRTFTRIFTRGRTLSVVRESRDSGDDARSRSRSHTRDGEESEKETGGRRKMGFFSKKALRKLRPDMIRRMDDAPKPIDPNGWITEEPHHMSAPPSRSTPLRTPAPSRSRSRSVTPARAENDRDDLILTGSTLRNSNSGDESEQQLEDVFVPPPPRASSDDVRVSSPQTNGNGTPNGNSPRMGRIATIQPARGVPMGHTLTVEFRTPDRSDFQGRARRPSSIGSHGRSEFLRNRSDTGTASRRYSTSGDPAIVHDDRHVLPGTTGYPLGRRTTTDYTYRSHRSQPKRNALHTGYGGFPGPQTLLIRLFRKLFPNLQRRFVRSVTLPRTQTLSSAFPGTNTYSTTRENGRSVPYITFDAIVGRNSKFHLLTEENLEELGGVEYRALTALLWIVGGYHFGVQLIAFTIIAPYISAQRWRSIFETPMQRRYVPPSWFAAFQVVSAYTNAGMSLVDQSMVPFQKAYPMILAMIFLILAGNTAFPIFLRLTIWILTKIVPSNSRLKETLHFLLDHPRRCFIYLFPSHQTWFLLTVLVMLNGTDWFFFLILDIGNPYFESIPAGVRVIIGLLQATAVRAAGFATVSLSALVPAVQALYVMMMYISVYPIAMSVRSTNVYEEKSLGVYEPDDEDDEEEPRSMAEGPRVAVWGRYLAWHARRQLAFDMWWLGLALFLVCIIEKHKIEDQNNFQWFTIFAILFELISAYGGVGLSLGVPYDNFSFSGAFSPLSKLIVCAVMIRGRHRGLPVAIDRAVMLPFEFKKQKQDGPPEPVIDQSEPAKPEETFRRTATKTQADFSEKPSSEIHGS